METVCDCDKKNTAGRNPIPEEKKRVSFGTMLDPDFLNNFRKWCIYNDISQGKALETVFREATDNFQNDLYSLEYIIKNNAKYAKLKKYMYL